MKLKITVTCTYDVNPDEYGTDDPADIAAADQTVLEDDLDTVLGILSDTDEEDVTVTVEAVEAVEDDGEGV